ncbi:MAG: Obg family GTPase CgtA [Candidatus Omnitrophica bacterium]|nr:Obg family GTPase CgtA [Candidatus Omnitrophota bacterium]
MKGFADQAEIRVEAGRGGNGCRSFYADLWSRHPIPDGGNGGRGGDVLIRANVQLTTLHDLLAQRHFRAAAGGNGSSKKKHGANGKPCLVQVPPGTLVRDADTDDLIRELLTPEAEVVVAAGGAGGIGNAVSRISPQRWKKFKDKTPAPIEGEEGQRRRLTLTLKVLADVGIVGLPNAGKSTLISRVSAARPQVAAFPFTTKSPVLGVVVLGGERRVVAVDVPGLIEGAHRGRGLGLAFLRHIERTRVLVHLIDMAAVDGRDPAADYRTLLSELKAYDPRVAAKPQVLAANKMDLPRAQENLKRFRRQIRRKILPISAETGEGLKELLAALAASLEQHGMD